MNDVPCGLQVYCLIKIMNLLTGVSLLAPAKSIYYLLKWYARQSRIYRKVDWVSEQQVFEAKYN